MRRFLLPELNPYMVAFCCLWKQHLVFLFLYIKFFAGNVDDAFFYDLFIWHDFKIRIVEISIQVVKRFYEMTPLLKEMFLFSFVCYLYYSAIIFT